MQVIPNSNPWNVVSEGLGRGIQGGLQQYFANQQEEMMAQKQMQRDQMIQQQQRQQQQAQQQQEMSALQQALSNANDPQSQLQAILQAPISNETKKLASQSILAQQKINQPKAAPGGISAQPVPPQVGQAIGNVLSSNPNASSDELGLAFDSAGIPRTYSNSYIENRRRQDESRAKNVSEEKDIGRKETSEIRKDIANKADIAEQSIANKENLLKIIDSGKLDDPTFAALMESLPFGYGKRLLSPETVEYKAGLVEEFRDLKTLFSGATRVAELDILQQKIADTYLTDEQKKRVLKARMKALDADVIRAEVASELETDKPGLGVLQFNKELQKRMKDRSKHVQDQVIDDLKSVQQEADLRKKRKLDASNPDDLQIVKQIIQEANGNMKKAKKLALDKGYKF